MSMNPARTVASALPAQVWTDAWIYFLAPPLGMLLAAQAVFVAARIRRRPVLQAAPRQRQPVHFPLPLPRLYAMRVVSRL